MVMPSADPIQWREETERVSQRLKEKDTVVEKTGEWRGHLAMLRDYTNKGEINSKSVKSKNTENTNLNNGSSSSSSSSSSGGSNNHDNTNKNSHDKNNGNVSINNGNGNNGNGNNNGNFENNGYDLLANGNKNLIIENLEFLRIELSEHLKKLSRSENIINLKEIMIKCSNEYSVNKKVRQK